MNIQVRNCNNIEEGNIAIEEGKLNIKYAINGTGKSTIARSIAWINEPNNLLELKTFGTEIIPSVITDVSLEKVVIFNTDFINNIVFKGSDVIENAFEVFIKTPSYDVKRKKVDDILKTLKTDLFRDDNLQKLYDNLKNIMNKINYENNKIAKRGVYKSILQQDNNIPVELTKYSDFLNDNNNKIEWVDWKSKGFVYDDKCKCPFCAEDLKNEYQIEKKKFTETYKKADIKNVTEILEIIETGKDYLLKEKYELLITCIREAKAENEIKSVFEQFMAQVVYLLSGINKIQEFNSYQIEINEIGLLDEKVKELKLNLSYADYFTSISTKKIIEDINTKIEKLLTRIDDLKREIATLNTSIIKTINKSIEDVNNFLEIAGLNYSFDIVKDKDEKTSKAVLKYLKKDGSKIDVDNIADHLSWGEKNAFSLVLFMYYAISQDADFIILDDPISSFDGNKKYAINYRLFENRNGTDKLSLFNRTVLLLTHDIEPVIDFGKIKKPMQLAKLNFLKNIHGVITESKIEEKDIKSVVDIYYRNSKKEELNIIARISFLRKYIEFMNVNNFEEADLAYNILSSIIHNENLRKKNLNGNFENMTPEEITKGTNYIKEYITNFDYEKIRKTLKVENIVQEYKNEINNYIKIQIFRLYVKFADKESKLDKVILKFIDEFYHIENDYIFSLDLLEFDMIPTSIMDKLDEYMNNIK